MHTLPCQCMNTLDRQKIKQIDQEEDRPTPVKEKQTRNCLYALTAVTAAAAAASAAADDDRYSPY